MGTPGYGFDQVDGPPISRRLAQPVDPLHRGRRPMSSRYCLGNIKSQIWIIDQVLTLCFLCEHNDFLT